MTCTIVCSPAELQRLLTPRSDVVVEAPHHEPQHPPDTGGSTDSGGDTGSISGRDTAGGTDTGSTGGGTRSDVVVEAPHHEPQHPPDTASGSDTAGGTGGGTRSAPDIRSDVVVEAPHHEPQHPPDTAGSTDSGGDTGSISGRDTAGTTGGNANSPPDIGEESAPRAVFGAVDGPFRHYRRTVEVLEQGDFATLVRRRISRQLPAPLRPWLVRPLVDRTLRRRSPYAAADAEPRNATADAEPTDATADAEPTDAADAEPTDAPATATAFHVRQRFSYQLSVPFWSWFLTPLVNRELRRPRSDGRQPLWAPAERLDVRSGEVLGLLCLLAVVAGYLGTLLSQTITFAFEEFGAGLATQGNTLTAVRIGVLLAFALVALADRRGRRPVLLFSAGAGCIAAAVGAASAGVWTYGTSQTVSRSLATTMLILLLVMAAEEVPAGARAYAVSMLTLASGLGSGMVVWLLPLADLGTRAWRLLFLAPLLALPLIAYCARRLEESKRFAPHLHPPADPPNPTQPTNSTDSTGLPNPASLTKPAPSADPTGHPQLTDSTELENPAQPADKTGLAALAQPTDPTDSTDPANPPAPGARHDSDDDHRERRRQRLFLLGLGAMLFSLYAAPASQFLNEFLRTERLFSASRISIFQLTINTPAVIGLLVAGRVSDVKGRRLIGALGLLGAAVFVALRYAQGGWPMWMWGVLAGIFGLASVPIMGAFGAELFGTASRAGSNGVVTVMGVVGSIVGLQIVGRFTDAGGDFGQIFALLAAAPLLVALLVLLALPETAQRELEDLNPEDIHRRA